MRFHKSNAATPYPIYSKNVASVSELTAIEYPSRYFVLLIAADFDACDRDQLVEIAKKLIDKGLAYICAWGPGCEMAHDAFDFANVIWEEENGKEFHVMSTWHNDEPLEEALWFCIFNATVDDEYWEECSTVTVSVGESNWEDLLIESLSDITLFNDKMVNG